MSLRTRLALAVVAVLVVTISLFGVILIRSTEAALIEQIDEQVLAFASRAEGRKPPPDSGQQPPPTDGGGSEGETEDYDLYERTTARLVYSETGTLLVEECSGFQDNPDSPPSVPPIPSDDLDGIVGKLVTAPSQDGTLRYRMLVTRDAEDGTITVSAAPLRSVDAAVSYLTNVLLLIGGVVLALAALAGWWIIRHGLRPVDQMVDTAAAIAAGDLSRRVPSVDPRTELGRLAQALNEMLHQIERAIQARAASEERLRRFVADAAHELRTPLTSLRGYAELYRQGALPTSEAVDNAMRRIESEGERMSHLVDDLLLLARLDQHRGLEAKPVEMETLVRDAVADFCAVEPTRPVTVEVDGSAVVRGDALRLRQVIDNILGNVRMHTPPETPVAIRMRRDARDVVLAIADQGPGIAPADQEHIFERFWRTDSGRGRSRGGTGLGLAIVASLVEAHGGTIAVESRLGHGATFTIRLPLADPTDEAPASQTEPAARAEGIGAEPPAWRPSSAGTA